MTHLIIGMGKTGLSIARYWRSLGYAVLAIDNRPAPPYEKEFIQLLGEDNCRRSCNFCHWECKQFINFEQVAISPGLNPDSIAVPFGKRCNDASLFAEHWQKYYKDKSYIVAVTGTNGKSTTVTLIEHIAKQSGKTAAAIGNIGKPMLDAILQWGDNPPDIVAVELSSFQLTIAENFYSDAAVVLNISEDHLDRHQTIERYARIKGTIYNNTNLAIINCDDPLTQLFYRKMADNQKCQTLSSSLPDTDWSIQNGAICYRGQPYIIYDELPASCQQQIIGTIAALALIKKLIQAHSSAFSNFIGLAHRQQWITEHNQIAYINDSKATNVSSALLSIQNIEKPIVWIAGGQGKEQNFTPLKAIAPKLRAAILMGEDAQTIAKIFEPNEVDCQFANSMDSAVKLANQIAQKGDAVLLSPACASFDMFHNFEMRGNQFINAVSQCTKEVAR